MKRWLVALAVALLPRLYLAYMWLVWKTSTVRDVGCDPELARDHYGRLVIATWHDEVFFVSWAYRFLRPHTLASYGDFGEVITRMLELCDFRVFRGGSSTGKSRRSPEVVPDMIAHMNQEPGVVYGITVDGSRGPVYRMKHGAPRIAVACRAPVLVEKTWCRRHLRLGTWDRTLIPLPFNRIVRVLAGPYLPPQDADGPEAFEAFRLRLENALLDITYHARTLVEDRTGQEELLRNYPPQWRPAANGPDLVHPFDEVDPAPPAIAASASL